MAIWGSIAVWVVYEVLLDAPTISVGLNVNEQMGIAYQRTMAYEIV